MKKLINLKSLLIVSFISAALCLMGAGYIPAKALLAQYLLEKSWQKSRMSQSMIKPWPWADTYAMARIKIPRLDMDVVVLSGSSGETLAFAPGHSTQSVLPGRRGNSIISAHKDTFFENLNKLQTGDAIYVQTVDGKSFEFKVTAQEIVNTQEQHISLFSDQSKLTLITCYPLKGAYSNPDKRFVIFATNVNKTTNENKTKGIFL